MPVHFHLATSRPARRPPIKAPVESGDGSKHQSAAALDVSPLLAPQVFHVPLEERKYKDINQFGEGDQAKVCVDIMHKTGAHLELSLAKDQGLSIMVSGKLDAVMKARKEIVSRLQTQVRSRPDGRTRFTTMTSCYGAAEWMDAVTAPVPQLSSCACILSWHIFKM